MTARLDIELPADKLATEYNKVLAEAVKLRTENNRLKDAAGELGAKFGTSFRQLTAIAQQAKSAMTGPAAQYAAEAAKIEEALKRKMLTEQQAGAALDQLAGKYASAAGPADQYAIRIERLGQKLAAGQISQQGYDAAIAQSRQASLAAADGADRYQIELTELARQLKAGEVSQASYDARLADTKARMLAAAGPVDQLKIKLAGWNRVLEAGSIPVSTYDAAIAKLAADVGQTADPVTRLQQQLVLLNSQLQRGTIDGAQHAQQAARLRAEFGATASPVDQYRQKLAGLVEQLRRNQIGDRQYQDEVRRLREQFGGSTTAAQRYQAQLDLVKQRLADGKGAAHQYGTAMRAANDETTKTYQAAPAAIGAITGQLTGLVSGMLSVGGIISQIRAVMEEAKQLRNEQLAKQMTVGEAQGETVKMLGQVSTPEADRFLAAVAAVGQETKFKDTTALYLAAADTLSATASNQELTLTVLKQAAPLFRARPQQIGEFAGAVADLATIQGAKTEQDVKGVVSEVLSVTSQARITSLAAFKEAAAAIAGATVTDTGEDRGRAVREAGAAFAAIGGAIKDPEGALTKTATSMLATQLERLLPEKDIVGPVSDQRRAELLREQARLQEKIKTAEDGTGSVKAANLRKAQADLADVERKAQEAREPGKDSRGKLITPDAIEIEKLDAQAEQLREKIKDMEQGKDAGVAADAAEVDLARQRLKMIDQQLTGVIRKGTGAQTLAERVAMVQESPELQRLFFEGDQQQGVGEASFSGPIEPVIRELLTRRDSEAAQRFATAQKSISADTGAYDQLVKNLQEASPQLRLQQQAVAGAALTEGFDVSATAAARRAKVDELATEALIRSRQGESLLFQMTDSVIQSLGTGAQNFDTDQEAIDARIAQVLQRRERLAGGGVIGRGLSEQQVDQMGTSDQWRGERLRSVAAIAGSQPDAARLAKLDGEQRKTVEYLDQMIRTLLQIAEPPPEPVRQQLAGQPAAVAQPPQLSPVDLTRDVRVQDVPTATPGTAAQPTPPPPVDLTRDVRVRDVPTATPAAVAVRPATAAAVPVREQLAVPPPAPIRAAPEAESTTEVVQVMREVRDELKEVRADGRRTAEATSETRDATTRGPRVGASAAAAAAPTQRQGR